MSELERLRDRVAELEDALGLTADLPRSLIPRELAGTRQGVPGTVRFISMLLTRPFGNREAIYSALYGDKPEQQQPCPKILDVYASNARKILAAHGIEFQTIRGEGWRLDNENKAKLRAVIQQLNNKQQQAA